MKRTFRVGRATHIDHMHERIRLSQVVQEAIPKALSHMRTRDQTRYIEELNGYASPPVDARAIVGLAPAFEANALAGAFNLQISYRTLRIDGCES